LLVLQLFFLTSLRAQQDNLWTTEFGSRSALTGSAVTASVRDNSAIYYNPGALGFIYNSNIGLSANIANFYSTYIKDGAGEGNNIYNPYFNFVPQFVSGIIKLEEIPDVTFTYAIFNKHKSKLSFTQKSSFNVELFDQFQGEEEFNSSYEYRDEILETWVGIGAGFMLSQNWSVGFSTFFSYRSENNFEGIDNIVFDVDKNIVANSIFSNQLEFYQMAMLFKAGVAFEDEYINWGATITTTGVRLGLFTGSTIQRLENVEMPDQEGHYYRIYNEWVGAWYKHPWEFDTGVQVSLFQGLFSARITYMLGFDPYTMASFDKDAKIIGNDAPIFDQKNEVRYANKSVINFAFGYERKISDNIMLLSGFKVDNNVFDSNNLSRDEFWVPTKSYWNLYTASLGADFITKRGNNLIVGASYRFTNRDGDTQVVNITNPDPNNYLLGPKTNDTATNIYGLSLVLGYTYNFSSKTKKDILEKIKLKNLIKFHDD